MTRFATFVLLISGLARASFAAEGRPSISAKPGVEKESPNRLSEPLSGKIWPRHAIDNTSIGADGVKFADVNGDDLPDIITGWEEGGEVRVYLNPGPEKARQPWPRVTVGKVARPEDAILMDLDGDGQLDGVSATEGDERTVFVHWAARGRSRLLDPMAWTTQPIPETRGRQMWMFLLPLQMDGHNGSDIVTGSKLNDAAIGWLRAPANPRDLAAWTWHPLRPAGWIMSLLARDIDGDSDLDVLFSDRRGPASGIGWLENPGAAATDRGEPWPEHRLAAQGREVMFLDTGDLDEDGRFDIVAAVKPSSILFLHRQPSRGWREEWIDVATQCGTAKAVKLADVDLDGRVDLVYSCEGATGDLRGIIWLRQEAGRWQAHDLGGPPGTKYDLLATLDLDGDGDLDVITCEESDNLGVIWYENPARTFNAADLQHDRGDDQTADLAALPEVPPGFTVNLFAKEPLVRNPCSMAFDERGRLFVGQGPQYRKPKPDTPHDSIVILEDTNGDGVADRAKTFASGFNCIQGLVWRGRDLYVANSPDLTLVRDLDGDDEADEYVKLYTDLGNLEHALHGLNFAPDGRLYMSKGNSKGLNRPGCVAPKPFRELWGLGDATDSPQTPPQVFKKGEYRATYQDPEDDWGREGGVLRCDPDGGNLEIVSRGLRNPWDINFSDTFDWIGTDNDQTSGDRIFSPFPGAHFGWNHVWSSSWTGENHPSTAPVSGPLFDGSGTGVVFCDVPQFPASHRGVFFVGDWLRKVVYLYRPRWEGAWLLPEGGRPQEFIRGGKALFRPTDLGAGPDGALYVLGWGKDYGVTWKDGKQANEGRVFRINAIEPSQADSARPSKPPAQWSVKELIADFTRPLPVWRMNAQEELVRRGSSVIAELQQALRLEKLSAMQETWIAWTLGRMALQDSKLDDFFARMVSPQSTINPGISTNLRLQALRILGDRARRAGRPIIPTVAGALSDPEPRLRLAAVEAIREARAANCADALWTLTAAENDRIVYYAAWNALKNLLPTDALKAKLAESRTLVRRAALLALLETRSLKPEQVQPLTRDPDPTNARLAHLFLENSGVIEPARTAAIPGSEHAPMGPISPALRPPTKPTTVADALPLVAAADPKRGEQIFMGEGGPGCWMCHRVNQRGRSFGPDLTTVGDRNDPRYVVESILAPNAIVTEGYATLQVSTRNECDLTGLLVEETDTVLTLAQATGPPLRIRKDRLTNRQSLHTSPMPSHAEALGAHDVADVVAFLMAQRSGPEASLPARPVSTQPAATVAFTATKNAFAITIAGKPFATYVFKDPKVLRPYLAHVRARSGVQVTRNFPPIAGQDATDHDAIHPGIWFAVGDLNGADFWRNKATVEHVRFVNEPRGGSDAGEFTVLNRYVHEGTPLAEETARWRFLIREQGVLILYESEFRPAGEEFYFGDQEEIGFAIRLATPLAVNNGGWMRDSLGRRNEKGIWGKTADWVAYGGRIGDETIGVLLMPSPSNFRPCWFHARDYGFVAANPFGRKAFTGGEPSRVVVKRGETLRLGYGMLLFARAAGSEPDFAAAYRDFSGVIAGSRSGNEK